MKIISAKNQKTSEWGGGSTTELYIHPESSSYADRNFQFRLSTATVEVEESEFTSLPNFARVLMVLDGKMKLVHEGNHEIELNPFEVDRFEGEWKTRSFGSCKDFNLMLGNGVIGDLTHQSLSSGEVLKLEKFDHDFVAIYTYKGSGTFNSVKERGNINEKDFIILERRDRISISSNGELKLIMALIDIGTGTLKGLQELLEGKN